MIDDGTVSRLAEQTFRWTAADPSLRWFRQNAARPRRRDRGRLGGDRGAGAAGADVGAAAARRRRRPTSIALKYFRVTSGTIAGVPVDISRTGYTGDLGYEIWMPAARALDVWDALMERRPAVRHQAGRHAGARRRARSRPGCC